MRRVCRGWKSAAAAPDFALARQEAGANEDLVFLLQFCNPAAGEDGGTMDGDAPENSPAYGVAVYNVTTGEWHREREAPPMPMFAQCAAVGTRLAVMGGWDSKTFEPVADVHVLDAATGVWRRGTPMRSARSFFACAEAGGKIYVAGGHDKLKNALKTAEAYDAVADGWDPLPDMSEERDECDGMATVAGDRFLAVSGYRTGGRAGSSATRSGSTRRPASGAAWSACARRRRRRTWWCAAGCGASRAPP
ncbi:hypothetical protein QYE76_064060 [Lolium multiflorum]|uniref:F-box/kelch-repeat protein n=1 Tax=Lolium multiflorum TaxID=4521 RepID=A0AAD8S6T6_LOLMU|nr:hypothetical protein QYE76_064060 [Lolium multiflorum]